MARYLETAKEANAIVERLHHELRFTPTQLEDLAHLVNLTVRCSPRGVQGTVRKNIVQAAMGKHCRVSMTREVDEKTGREYNKIHIVAKETS
jgi:hypothetical protein